MAAPSPFQGGAGFQPAQRAAPPFRQKPDVRTQTAPEAGYRLWAARSPLPVPAGRCSRVSSGWCFQRSHRACFSEPRIGAGHGFAVAQALVRVTVVVVSVSESDSFVSVVISVFRPPFAHTTLPFQQGLHGPHRIIVSLSIGVYTTLRRARQDDPTAHSARPRSPRLILLTIFFARILKSRRASLAAAAWLPMAPSAVVR